MCQGLVFDGNDLRRILNISLLNKNGYRISQIAGFNDSRLNNELLTLSGDTENLDIQIGSLIKAMIDFDEILFEKVYSQSTELRGFQDNILKIIYPFFKRVGILWLTDNIDPAQEHFVSNLTRQKIIIVLLSQCSYLFHIIFTHRVELVGTVGYSQSNRFTFFSSIAANIPEIWHRYNNQTLPWFQLLFSLCIFLRSILHT